MNYNCPYCGWNMTVNDGDKRGQAQVFSQCPKCLESVYEGKDKYYQFETEAMASMQKPNPCRVLIIANDNLDACSELAKIVAQKGHKVRIAEVTEVTELFDLNVLSLSELLKADNIRKETPKGRE